jgi:hypothetical protein
VLEEMIIAAPVTLLEAEKHFTLGAFKLPKT